VKSVPKIEGSYFSTSVPLLRSLKKAMDRLQEKAGFYIRADLYSAIIREGEEEK